MEVDDMWDDEEDRECAAIFYKQVGRAKPMSRSEIFDYQAGREARIKGVPRDRRKNVDWLRGWDDAQDDYNAEDSEAKWKKGQEP